jgi:hypothetical protein
MCNETHDAQQNAQRAVSGLDTAHNQRHIHHEQETHRMGLPIIKEPKSWDRTSVTLPSELWARIDTNLKAVNASRPAPERYSRDGFMAECLEWAMVQLEKDRASKGGQK